MGVRSRFLSTAALAAAMTASVAGVGLAQEATPTTMVDDVAMGALPAHLHQGSCANLGDEPVERLADVQFPAWVGAMLGGDDAAMESEAVVAEDFGNAPVPVAVSTTEVAIPLADIVAGGHAIRVELAAPDDPEDAIACADIGGVVDENGDLFVGIEPVNESGHSGTVWLHDNGASTTIVIFLDHPDAKTEIATALMTLAEAAMDEEKAATPAAAEATPVAESDATPVT
jgi:hypothetical protein